MQARLQEWALEMGARSEGIHHDRPLPSPEEMQQLFRGNGITFWEHLVTHARPAGYVNTAAANVKVHRSVAAAAGASTDGSQKAGAREAKLQELLSLEEKIRVVESQVVSAEQELSATVLVQKRTEEANASMMQRKCVFDVALANRREGIQVLNEYSRRFDQILSTKSRAGRANAMKGNTTVSSTVRRSVQNQESDANVKVNELCKQAEHALEEAWTEFKEGGHAEDDDAPEIGRLMRDVVEKEVESLTGRLIEGGVCNANPAFLLRAVDFLLKSASTSVKEAAEAVDLSADARAKAEQVDMLPQEAQVQTGLNDMRRQQVSYAVAARKATSEVEAMKTELAGHVAEADEMLAEFLRGKGWSSYHVETCCEVIKLRRSVRARQAEAKHLQSRVEEMEHACDLQEDENAELSNLSKLIKDKESQIKDQHDMVRALAELSWQVRQRVTKSRVRSQRVAENHTAKSAVQLCGLLAHADAFAPTAEAKAVQDLSWPLLLTLGRARPDHVNMRPATPTRPASDGSSTPVPASPTFPGKKLAAVQPASVLASQRQALILSSADPATAWTALLLDQLGVARHQCLATAAEVITARHTLAQSHRRRAGCVVETMLKEKDSEHADNQSNGWRENIKRADVAFDEHLQQLHQIASKLRSERERVDGDGGSSSMLDDWWDQPVTAAAGRLKKEGGKTLEQWITALSAENAQVNQAA